MLRDCLHLSSAELYDPSTETFTTTGDMTTARTGHTATLLPDGKVLIAGGYFLVDTPRGPRPILLASAELYDPATGTFSATGDMVAVGSVCCADSAILLADGKVLIAHGRVGSQPAVAELYDPVTGTFSRTGDQLVIWSGAQTATLLPDGRVLLVICCTAEQLYDPASGTFSLTDRTKRISQDGFGAAALTNGTVLFVGGYCDCGITSSGAEVYDRSTGSFSATGNMTTARSYHSVTPLGDRTVLIAGGQNDSFSNSAGTTAEIYDPATGTFARTGDMNNVHVAHTATLLLDGMVLITGGWQPYGPLASAEIYRPPTPVTAPMLLPVSGDRRGPVWHSTTGEAASSNNPAVAGEVLSLSTTSLRIVV
jgi:large repetitive protein